MVPSDETESSSAGSAGLTRTGRFPATRWSLVRTAGGDDTVSAVALSELCRLYWYPLYVFARRSGLNPPDSEDATQGFLARVIEKDYIARAREELGTLRSFLLRGLKNYLANERKAQRRLKRGGGQEVFSLDATDAERRYKLEPQDAQSPDVLFERRWATTVLNNVFEELRREYSASGKESLFDALKPTLAGERSEANSHASIGEALDMSEGAVKIAAYRMRQRFREILRDQVAQTVQSEEEVNGEILALFRVFSR
jgi:DNA-directed RNA polymerase specialized sigma24 family protein